MLRTNQTLMACILHSRIRPFPVPEGHDILVQVFIVPVTVCARWQLCLFACRLILAISLTLLPPGVQHPHPWQDADSAPQGSSQLQGQCAAAGVPAVHQLAVGGGHWAGRGMPGSSLVLGTEWFHTESQNLHMCVAPCRLGLTANTLHIMSMLRTGLIWHLKGRTPS